MAALKQNRRSARLRSCTRLSTEFYSVAALKRPLVAKAVHHHWGGLSTEFPSVAALKHPPPSLPPLGGGVGAAGNHASVAALSRVKLWSSVEKLVVLH